MRGAAARKTIKPTKMKEKITIIGIAGGTGSGKTTVEIGRAHV